MKLRRNRILLLAVLLASTFAHSSVFAGLIFETGTLTVIKTWFPGRTDAFVEFDWSCENAFLDEPAGVEGAAGAPNTNSGSGSASTETSFTLDLTWENTESPTCTITEKNLEAGFSALVGECTNVPLVANDGVLCDLQNEVLPVPFTVIKDFTDDNPAEVTIELVSCTGGAFLVGTENDKASEGSPAQFTIGGILDDGSTTCTFKEVDPGIVGYTPGICQGFLALETGGTCELVNTQDPVNVMVDKIYSEAHPTPDADPEVDITLTCDQAMVDGNAGSSTVTTVDGRATFVVSDFLFDGSGCFATEAVPAGYVQDTTDDSCGVDLANPGFIVVPGGTQLPPVEMPALVAPATCTITNDPTVATFTIEKDFSDNNPMAVDVTATCSDDGMGPGLSMNGAAGITASGSASEATPFEVEIKYADGSASCDGAEDNDLPGYTTEPGDGPAADCGADQTVAVDSTDVACEIFNDQDPIEIQASKVYSNGGSLAVDFAVSCTNLDAGGTVTPATAAAAVGAPAIFTVNDVMWDGSTLCSVSEPVPPGGYYETANTCTTDLLDMTPNSDDPRTCDITNTPTRATFMVTKFFDDGNDVDEIEVAIDCNTGLILDQDKDLGDDDSVEFVVTSFTEGTLNCTITEDGQTGYSGEYNNISLTVINDESCEYLAVGGGDAYRCEITNTPDPVDVTATKEWVFESSSPSDIDTSYKLTLYCDAEIIDGNPIKGGPSMVDSPAGYNGPGCGLKFPDEVTGDNGYSTSWCKAFYGDGEDVFPAEVIPNFPDSSCYWVESQQDQSVEVDQSDCQNLTIKAGVGASCTIVNTLFFEGIPTLSQYGMALMALLMLGVGFVSFRRFS